MKNLIQSCKKGERKLDGKNVHNERLGFYGNSLGISREFAFAGKDL